MACRECVERREKLIDAVLEGRIAAATRHAIKGAAEMVGLKEKTASVEDAVLAADNGGEVEAPVGIDHPSKKSRAPRS